MLNVCEGLVYSDPNGSAYAVQKGVEFIVQETSSFPDVPLPLKEVSWIGDGWKEFYGPQIALSAMGTVCPDGKCFPRTFPGPVIPGPRHSEQHIGYSAWEVFQHMTTIPERVVSPANVHLEKPADKHVYRGEKPAIEQTKIDPPDSWRWGIDIPELLQLQLNGLERTSSESDLKAGRSELFTFLENKSGLFWKTFGEVGLLPRQKETRKMLELIQLVQTPHVENFIPDRVVTTARQILEQYRANGQAVKVLPLVFQLESSLMYAHLMAERVVVAKGLYINSWIEVVTTKVEEIKSTELVDSKRAVVEVDNLVQRGWAPIITDERTNNSDGSHRGIAVRVWNLLKTLNQKGLLEKGKLFEEEFQEETRRFVEQREDMVGLTLRETLRVAQALLIDPEHEGRKEMILASLPNRPSVNKLPTILLREQEACCVVKQPFDEAGITIGVDPLVIHTITNGRADLALGSRGPYHRTDRTPAPWFNIFDLQK